MTRENTDEHQEHPELDEQQELDGRRLRRIEGRALLFQEAMRRYERGEPVELAAVAAAHGVGRTTAYRWFGTNDGLLAELVLTRQDNNFTNALDRHARKRGSARVVATLIEFLDHASASERFLKLLRREPGRALAIATSSRYPNQAALIAMVEGLLEEERARGLETAMDPPTLAYTIVKLIDALVYGAAAAGEPLETDRAREVFTKLLIADGQKGR